MLGLFNNWNIIILSHRAITSELFEEIRRVSLYVISNNMALLVQSDKYGSMNTTYSTTMGYYVINCFSEAYTLQEDTTCYGQIGTSGELVSIAHYIRCMQEKKKCCWKG